MHDEVAHYQAEEEGQKTAVALGAGQTVDHQPRQPTEEDTGPFHPEDTADSVADGVKGPPDKAHAQNGEQQGKPGTDKDKSHGNRKTQSLCEQLQRKNGNTRNGAPADKKI